MTTIALIGADGAGKTTIAHKLEESFPLPAKYLYMGANIESSNFRLPTSRLILYLKFRSYKKTAKRKGISDPSYISTHHNAHRSVKYGKIGSYLRLINRLVEGGFRQLISWIYQLRGVLVIYDRELQYDATVQSNNDKLSDRIYLWVLTHLYTRPDLVIFLDAPPEVLYSRKGEASVEHLQTLREAYQAQGEGRPNFIRVDASQPLDKVYQDVCQHIMGALQPKQLQF